MIYTPPFGMIAAIFASPSVMEHVEPEPQLEPYKAKRPEDVPVGTTIYGHYGTVVGTKR